MTYIITTHIGGFKYFLHETKPSPLYGHITREWNGLIENAKTFPDKVAAEAYNSKHHFNGEVKSLRK